MDKVDPTWMFGFQENTTTKCVIPYCELPTSGEKAAIFVSTSGRILTTKQFAFQFISIRIISVKIIQIHIMQNPPSHREGRNLSLPKS